MISQPKRRRRGFTLVEVLLVLVILAIIMGLVGVAIIPRLEEAKLRAAKTQIDAFRTPLESYRLSVGDFPSDLGALRVPPADAPGWKGPYMDRDIPPDPWGNAYMYQYPGQSSEYPDIWSAGPDRTSGTADDITSWQVSQP
jgi:general secretion pathway protein G